MIRLVIFSLELKDSFIKAVKKVQGLCLIEVREFWLEQVLLTCDGDKLPTKYFYIDVR